MIPPDEIFERSQQHFHAYRPIVEELFEVDLGSLLLKDINGYLADRGAAEDDDETRQEILDSVAELGGIHWDWMRSIYIFTSEKMSDETLARNVVHELSHAAHYALIRQGRAEQLSQRPLWKIVQEGFAEYVRLEAFAPYYDLPDIDALLENKKREHRFDYRTYKIFNLHKMYESLDDETRIESASPALRWLMRGKAKILKWLFDEDKVYYYPLGYCFFKKAADKGVEVLDVLRNLPEDLETILEPTDYIKEMTS